MTLNEKLQIAKAILGAEFPETRISDPSGPTDDHPDFYSIKIDEFEPPRFFVARIHTDVLAGLADPQTIDAELKRLGVVEQMKGNPNGAVEVVKGRVRVGSV